MIHVSIPNEKRILGGTAEERALFQTSLSRHFERHVVFVDKEPGVRYHVTFEEALADMETAQALVAEAMYQGADSVWDFTLSES